MTDEQIEARNKQIQIQTIKEVSEKQSEAFALYKQGKLEAAKLAAEESLELSKTIENNKKAKEEYKESANLYEMISQVQIKAAKETSLAQKDANDELEQSVQSQEEKIASLQAQLDSLQAKDVVIDINVEPTEAIRKIEELQQRIDRLNRSASGRAGGGAIGYAMGGTIAGFAPGGTARTLRPGMISGPGTGTSDSILARVSNGEHAFITRATRAKKLWPLLNTLNFGSDAVIDSIMRHLPAGLRMGGAMGPSLAMGYAGGGAIGSRDTVDINLQIGRQSVRLSGARDQANALVGALRELQRGI
jgi:hypothetical protein